MSPKHHEQITPATHFHVKHTYTALCISMRDIWGLTLGVAVLLHIPDGGRLLRHSVRGHFQLEEAPVRQLLLGGL